MRLLVLPDTISMYANYKTINMTFIDFYLTDGVFHKLNLRFLVRKKIYVLIY